MNTDELLKLAIGLSKRAESYDTEHLVNSFVEIGHLPALLKNPDSAVIYGRRGTGKTHLLSYLSSHLKKEGTSVVSIDMRTIGSSSGIYTDVGINLSERATRLLKDTANTIHEKILEAYTEPSTDIYGPSIIESLSRLLDAANSLAIDGAVTREEANLQSKETNNTASIGGTFALTASNFNAALSDSHKLGTNDSQKNIITGKQSIRINFNGLTSALEQVVRNLPQKRLWILLDEWSEVPLDLQPYLADMLRRGFLAVRGVTAKIAAIEHRTVLRLVSEVSGQSVGIEVGADVANSINLDDYMVFENDTSQASEFFSQMIFQHIRSIANTQNIIFDITKAADLTQQMFTQRDSFNEFVRAAEGVPRDAINILSKCAIDAKKEKISMPTVRSSARIWYSTSKQNDVNSRPRANQLLEWIKSEVIGKRKARGFLLDVNARDPLIDYLFDSRVLHIIKKGISSKDVQDIGKKFNAWSIDFGCYVELFNTSAAPRGLFEAEENEANSANKFVDVPQTDYRSLRRAILDLSAFNNSISSN